MPKYEYQKSTTEPFEISHRSFFFFWLFTGANDPKMADPNLFVPVVDNKLLPESVRRFFRFGVPHLESDYKTCSHKNGKGDLNHDDEKASIEKESYDNDSLSEKENML